MSDSNGNTQLEQPSADPKTALRSLDRLVGQWKVTGQGIGGTVTFEWMEGGAFLMQHVNLEHEGRTIKGLEIIGYDKASNDLKSHYFDSSGDILEYVWEISGDDLTIWFGSRDSESVFKGRFSEDGNTNSGGWVWPGGGYESSMTRVEPGQP